MRVHEGGFRVKDLDPDFRRDPKTPNYCSLCQRDIKGAPKFYAHFVDGCFAVVHRDDRALADAALSADDNYGLLAVGSECARRIGGDFLLSPAEAGKDSIEDVA